MSWLSKSVGLAEFACAQLLGKQPVRIIAAKKSYLSLPQVYVSHHMHIEKCLPIWVSELCEKLKREMCRLNGRVPPEVIFYMFTLPVGQPHPPIEGGGPAISHGLWKCSLVLFQQLGYTVCHSSKFCATGILCVQPVTWFMFPEFPHPISGLQVSHLHLWIRLQTIKPRNLHLLWQKKM